MITIDLNSEAGAKLADYASSPGVYKISIDVRGENHVAIKVNEAMWSHTMRANFLDA